MPSTYAHRRFGADVLALLPDGLRATLEQHRELYDIGLHGPDLMFYYKALQSNPVNRLGNTMHEQKGEVFFTRARTVVENAPDKDAALAYALGFVCHFALDSTCHPYVEAYVRESGVGHCEIETEFDWTSSIWCSKNAPPSVRSCGTCWSIPTTARSGPKNRHSSTCSTGKPPSR